MLRTKITVAFLAFFAAFLAGDYLVERQIGYRRFQELEEQLARQNQDRWIYAVEREISHLAEFAGDWTDWDDAYEFSQTGNEEFIESNLSSEDWFQSFNLPVLLFFNSDGDVVWERFASVETGERLELPALEAALTQGDKPLAVSDDRPSAEGIVSTSHGLLLVASRAIFKTDGSGPAEGFAVFGRFLDDTLAGSIAKQTLVAGAVVPFDPDGSDAIPPGLRQAIAVSDHDTVMQRARGKLHVYGLIDDVMGRPSILVRSDTPLTISAQGNYALWVSVLALGGAGLATLALQFGFIQWAVVLPLQRLIDHARGVGSSGDLTRRIGSRSRDEIGALAQEFDLMVEQLAISRGELVAQSRATGQAEIASSVTHNLGNILNSAAVAISSLRQRIDQMRADGCAKVAGLLGQHEAGLVEFLTRDERGKQLPKYLQTLAESLQSDRASILGDIARLEEQLSHMDEILGAQREVARRGTYTEVVFPHKIVGKAIDIVAPSLARHHVEVETDLPEVPAVESDPVQLVQVLVNLFTNAKEAMAATPEDGRRLKVRLRLTGADVAIDVQDSGPGLAPDHVERIFRAGVSTKGKGRGLGLHFCALAAKQLGGTLEARNAISSPGAVFTLRIPVERAAREGRAA